MSLSDKQYYSKTTSPWLVGCFLLLSLVCPPLLAEPHVAISSNVFASLERNEPNGIFIELLDRVMSEQGHDLRYLNMTSGEAARELRSGTVSIMTVVVPGDKLAEHAWFSDPVVMEYNVPLALSGKTFELNVLSDLHGKRIGGREGYRYPLLEGKRSIKLVRYRTNGEMIRALLLGDLDLAVISAVSDIFSFRSEGIMSRLEILPLAVGSVPLIAAFSKQYFSEQDVMDFNRKMAAFKQTADWQEILERNGMADLVHEWPVLQAE